MGCAVRVGCEVVDHEGDSCPGEDLLQHRSPPYRTNYNRSVRSPQHSPVPIADQWQPTACATLAPRGSRARLSTPIPCRKPLLFLLRRVGFRADGPRGRSVDASWMVE